MIFQTRLLLKGEKGALLDLLRGLMSGNEKSSGLKAKTKHLEIINTSNEMHF